VNVDKKKLSDPIQRRHFHARSTSEDTFNNRFGQEILAHVLCDNRQLAWITFD